MKRKTVGLLFGSLALAFGALSFSAALKENNHPEFAVTEAWSLDVKPSVAPSYYSAADGKTGSQLKSALANFNKPTSPSYDWSRYEAADEAQDDDTSILCVYTRHNIKKNSHCGGYAWDKWNREHVYTQSKFPNSDKDNHNIFACEGQINNYRGNLPFAEVKDKGGTRVTVFNHQTDCYMIKNSYFEPCDEAKGEIARACLYCTIYYGYDLTQIFDSADTALKWNATFPVTAREIYRNNVVYGLQGNRNPFIDHPSYAKAIYGGPEYQGSDPLSDTGVTVSPSSASIIEGNTVQLTATSTPSGTITWTTSNSSVATVSQSGVVTGVNAGTATITASSSAGSATCAITVTEPKTLSSLSVSGQKTSFTVGGTFVFGGTVTAHYTDSTTANVTASAGFSGYDLSTVGNQTVTVSYTEGESTKSTTYSITVSKSGGGESGTFSTTYSYANIGNTWQLTNYSSENEYALCPTGDQPSVGTFAGIFTDKTITSDVVVTINSATYGSGSCPTKSTYSLYNSSDCASEVTSTQTGTLPDSKTYTNVIYTVSQSTAASVFSNDLALKITKPGRQIRLKTVTIEFDYETQGSKTLTSFEVKTEPTKTTYNVGEHFDPTGLVITRHYSDSSSDDYTYAGHTSEFSFDPSLSSPLTEGDDIIEIFYGNESCLLSIEIDIPKQLDSIAISGYQASFTEGDAFSFGGTVTAYYTDLTSEDVTSSASFTGYNMTTVGNQTVTVSFGGLSQTYGITVSAGTLSSIAVSGMTTTFVKNAAFSFDGTCTATFANGYEKEVTPTSVSNPDLSSVGIKQVTVTYSYNGITKSTSYNITVNSYRVVMEASEVEGQITWPTSGNASVSGVTATVTNVEYTYYESGDKALRLGTGSGGGKIKIKASNIVSIQVKAKAYSSYSGDLSIGSSSINVKASSYTDYDAVEFASPVNELYIYTSSKQTRICIKQINIVCLGPEVDIGQTEDCLGLETYINNYMHMDYTENLGYCNDIEHHYYATAKAEFNKLNDHQRLLFTGNSAYLAEWTRLSTWASKNNDSLNSKNSLVASVNSDSLDSLYNDSSLLIIIIISSFATCSLLSLLIIKKRRYHK